ncbi:flippase [uncultured Draconibacterium sp.]|uniref:flippase n=1 Tax=uncultured Draconibacterium sp. TaxID=1573823 RepID=UPI0032165CB8
MRIKNTLNKYLNKLDIHTLEVVKKSSASTVVKVAGMAIGLGVSIFLGRTIGADGLGIINLSHRIVNILIVVGLLGMQQVIVKEVAIAHGKKDYEHIGNVMYSAYWLNVGITLSISIILILFAPWVAENVFHEPRLTYPLIIAIIVLTPQVFSRIFASGLNGYRKIWQSNLVDKTLSIFATGIFLLLCTWLNIKIDIINVAVCYGLGRLVVTVSIGLYWRSLNKLKFKRKYIGKQLWNTSRHLFIAAFANIFSTNIDVLMLGNLASSSEVGTYTVASRLALLISFFLQVTNSSISPKIAALYEKGSMKELELMIQKVTRGLGLIALIPLITFIIAGKFILGIWGNEFIDAYLILIILAVGQFFNISTGAAGLMLTMTGHEKTIKNISLAFVIINIFLNYFLIRFWGALGAALSMAIVVSSQNLIKVIYVKRFTKITTVRLI